MRKITAVFLAGAFVLLLLPMREFAAPAPKGNGSLAGYIYNEDMRTPVRNAVVKLRNVITLKEYVSEPTDTEGLYNISAIEEGRYVMGVQAPTGSYNFHYSIMIKSDALAKLSVAMKSGSEPVMLQSGFAEKKKTSIVEFFKSPAGIITALIAVEATLFAIVLLEEDEPSPVIID